MEEEEDNFINDPLEEEKELEDFAKWAMGTKFVSIYFKEDWCLVQSQGNK